MRQLKCSHISSFLSAITYAFSGFIVSQIVHVQIFYAACYAPLLFFFLIKSLREKTVYVVFTGITLAVMLLTGHIQPTIYFCFLMLVLCIYHSYSYCSARSTFKIWIKPMVLFFTASIIAFGLAAIQLFPFFEFIPHTLRSSTTFESMFGLGSIAPAHIISFIFPDFFGGSKIPFWGLDFARIGIHEVNYYMGIHVFLLLGLLLIGIPTIKKRPQYFYFFSVTGLVSLFLMMGSFTILSGWIYLLPGLNKIRLACRIGSVFNFSLAILAGYAFEIILNQRLEIKRILLKNRKYFIGVPLIIIGWISIFWINIHKFKEAPIAYAGLTNAYDSIIRFAIFFILFVIILYQCLSGNEAIKRVAIGAFVFLAIVDIFSYQMDFYPRAAFQEDPQNAFKKANKVSIEDLRSIEMPDIINNDDEIFRIRMINKYNAGRFSSINKIFSLGYSGAVSGTRLSNFRSIFENTDPPYTIVNPKSHFLDFYNVKYLYSEDDLVKFSDKFQKMQDHPNWYINIKAFKRAFCLNKYLVVEKEDEILKTMLDYDLDEYIILTEEPRFNHSNYDGKASQCDIDKYSNNEIEISADMKTPGFVVLSDMWYPGWRVYVDGKRAKLYRANYIFRGVEVSKGVHKIRFSYEPASLKTGSIVSLITVLITLLLVPVIKKLYYEK
ncbi:YfhO family protein [Candidatus Omnitrophota bacterium]